MVASNPGTATRRNGPELGDGGAPDRRQAKGLIRMDERVRVIHRLRDRLEEWPIPNFESAS